MFEKRRICWSLCGAAHMQSLRQLDNKFLGIYTNSFHQSLGLRGPTLASAREADKILWSRIFCLIDKQEWSFEQALHELTVVRGDIDVLLQPRPLLANSAPRPQPTRGTDTRTPRPHKEVIKSNTKGKGRGKGKGGGKDKGSLCNRYQEGKCNFGKDCNFEHRCKNCGGAHPAMDSQSKKTGRFPKN